MKNNSRIYNLLAAGTLTVLLLLTFLLFQNNRFGGVADAAALTGTTTQLSQTSNSVLTTDSQSAANPTVSELQAQNKQLMETLKVMQARERQYQTELNNASQALQTLQSQNSVQRFERRSHEEHELGERGYDD